VEKDNLIFQQVRSAIQALDLARAEELLNGAEDHCAEWHFLMGAVYYRKGWMDEARQHYEAAEKLEPENQEYRRAAEWMRSGTHYSPKDKSFGTLCVEDILPGLCCAAKICSSIAAVCGVVYIGSMCYGCWLCLNEIQSGHCD